MKIKKSCQTTAFFGFLFLIIIGTLWHFAFNFSGGSTLIGAFAPVNESVWEHLKLISFPIIPITALEFIIYGKDHDGFFAAKIISAFLGMIFIVMGYYTYVGMARNNSLLADVTLFIAASAISSFLPCILMKRTSLKQKDSIIWLTIFTVLVILFMYFTFNPPMFELFRDPITEDFGISSRF